jgi:hypothetical protein
MNSSISKFERPKIQNLGYLAGLIYKLNREASIAYEDLAAFGGHDCGDIISKHQKIKLDLIYKYIEKETRSRCIRKRSFETMWV